MKAGKGAKAVLLDRDGTILRDHHYLSNPDRIEIYKGVVPTLRRLKRRGWKVIIGTNQSGVGRGYFSVDAMHAVHDRLHRIFRRGRLHIDEIFFCPHHPEDGCHCRKPMPGMLEAARRKHRLDLSRCVVVGDKEGDILWGRRGGAKTVLVLTGKGRETLRTMKTKPDHVAKTLVTAAKWIEKYANDR